MEMLESCILQIIVHTYRDLSNYRARSYTNTLELHASNPLAYEICNYIDTNLTDIKSFPMSVRHLDTAMPIYPKYFPSP